MLLVLSRTALLLNSTPPLLLLLNNKVIGLDTMILEPSLYQGIKVWLPVCINAGCMLATLTITLTDETLLFRKYVYKLSCSTEGK